MYYSGGTEIVMSQVSEFISKNFKYTIRCEREDVGNLIGLPYPYTTPCANECFVEMYYWDTYFINVGLLASGNIEQAKHNADNIRFLINKYGYMPNGNRKVCIFGLHRKECNPALLSFAHGACKNT